MAFFSSGNWDPYVNFEYRIQNHFCVILGGWDISKPKWESEMAWSGPSSARLVSRCPHWPLPVPDNLWETSLGNLGPLRASQGMTRPASSQLGHLKAILVLWGPLQISMNIILSISIVLQISQPPNIVQKWFCIQNLHMDISFQKKQTV